MPFSVVTDFGSAASIKADEFNLKHFKALEILTQQFGENIPFGPSLANHGKGVPSRLVLVVMSTPMVRLFGKQRNAVLAMDPDQTGGGGILNAAANAATSAFAPLDICWCSKLQQITNERLGFKPKRVFQYFHAILGEQYLQDNRLEISQSDEESSGKELWVHGGARCSNPSLRWWCAGTMPSLGLAAVEVCVINFPHSCVFNLSMLLRTPHFKSCQRRRT
jgi:hypothetical protein